MKPGDFLWVYHADVGLVEVEITLVEGDYAAVGVVVGTGQGVRSSQNRFQPTRLGALEVALEIARKAARKAEGFIYATDAERDAWPNTERHLAGLVLAELERGVAS
jgi:hypothetical protein